MSSLTRALLALGEPLELVALGGRDSGAIPPGVGYQPEPLHPPTNLGWMAVGLPRAAARAGVDVIHAPAYTAPFWAPAPVVLTIHDVSYQRHPEWFPYRRDAVRRAFYRASAHAASHIVTDSRFSAAEIAAAYGVPAGRLTVIPLGVDAPFQPHDAVTPVETPPGVRLPFLLHVGDLHERRNLGVVVEALVTARRLGAVDPALCLVLAGVDRGIGPALSALAAAAGCADIVVRLGAVSENDLRHLYRSATALVYPSLYEGFGLPLLEGMASGTPIIAARTSSIPEVVGDAGLLLDARDVGAWSEAIVLVVNDAGTRSRMIAAGLRRASEFTWGRTARATLDVYLRTAGDRGLTHGH